MVARKIRNRRLPGLQLAGSRSAGRNRARRLKIIALAEAIGGQATRTASAAIGRRSAIAGPRRSAI